MKGKLHKDMMLEFDICPAGVHNFNEKVERKNRKIIIRKNN